jgi:hypothetical protein
MASPPRWAAAAQPKPEPLSPSTRAKLVTDVARLLVTKCPHVPLNTYMQFGSAYDKDMLVQELEWDLCSHL